MRRFRFRLEAALENRRATEERAQRAYSEAARLVVREEGALAAIEARLALALQQRSEAQSEAWDLGAMQDRCRLEEALREAALRQCEKLETARRDRSEKAAELKRCHVETETLAHWRSRCLEEHQRAELQEEQKLLDEAATAGWRNRKAGADRDRWN